MEYREKIKNLSFYSTLFMESIFPHKTRKKIISFLRDFSIFLGLLFIGLTVLGIISNEDSGRVAGVFLILFYLYLVFFVLEAFFASYYRNRESEVLAAKIIYKALDNDLLYSLLKSDIGNLILFRAEISKENVANFLKERKNIPVFDLPNPREEMEFITLKDLGIIIQEQDTEFQGFLSGFGIDKNIFGDILDWVTEDFEREYRREIWWSRQYLSKTKGIGKNWAFGRPYHLIKYGEEATVQTEKSFFDFDIKEFADEVSQMERVLARGRDSNVILVGDDGAGISDMILEFIRKISRGKITPELEYKRTFFLNWNNLIAFNKNKNGFENEFINILNESVNSGNIILIIRDLPGFILSAEALGSRVGSILESYLGNIQIIATSDSSKFHKNIESNGEIMTHFEKMVINETNEKKTIKIIENTVRKFEKKNGIFFSYLAVLEIVRGASQYIPGSVMPDGAIDLLFETISSLPKRSKEVLRGDVLEFLELKTKIPLGKLNTTEKDTLLNLEMFLGGRVIGQKEALSVVSNAMRRTRANIRNSKKPIGTFLFLGPTGVGKTETAKALSQIFFGDEKHMLRLDMTEYQSQDSLQRLIGSFEIGKPGVLSRMLRDNPYGVLLLDEFEKADKDVLNLFLQILDEGVFSDMDGKKVSLRNVIIIATSNAASDYIFSIVKNGKKPEENKDLIINKIVSDGIYKPELINRFDATVIFHPLSKEELQKIAMLMLKKLKSRLAEKGIEFVINDALALSVATLGANDMFGARPMNRFIQDKIEEPIARKIISGELSGGGRVEIKLEDLN